MGGNIEMNKVFWLGLGIGLGFLAVLAALFLKPYTFRGSVVQPPYPAPEIVLQDSHGATFHLAGQRGKPVAIFFGYTRCPDICPATLENYRLILEQLGSQADQVQFVLITVDPAFDRPEVMNAYLQIFDSRIVGLVGNETDLKAVWKAYGVYREMAPASENTPEELESHSAATYLIDKQGRLRATYSQGVSPSDLESDIRYLIKE
jgi:protein SCO1/2